MPRDTGSFGPIIHRYSRAAAIRDGELVDVSRTAREAGIRLPVALTRRVWQDCVAWSDVDTRRCGVPQDEPGRLWDVLWVLAAQLRRTRPRTSRVEVTLRRVPISGRTRKPQPVTVVAVCGPGDRGEPVITVQSDEFDD